jgi:hypothetical protein
MARFYIMVFKQHNLLAKINIMKNTILFVALAGMMASCGSNSQQQAAIEARQVDSMKNVMAQKQIMDSMNAVVAARPVMLNNEQQMVSSGGSVSHEHHSRSVNHNNGTTRTETNTTSNNTATTVAPAPATAPAPAPAPVAAPVKQRKGIGPVAGGAIIGAGAGAITGALVDKNKGAGALIGGVLGAGAGAGAGALIKKHQKNKDGE